MRPLAKQDVLQQAAIGLSTDGNASENGPIGTSSHVEDAYRHTQVPSILTRVRTLAKGVYYGGHLCEENPSGRFMP